MAHVIQRCPACAASDFIVERFRCTACGTAIEGKFSTSKLGSLVSEHQEFIEVFVRCRGNIKDVERVLGISYPTVRGRLDRAIHALGYESENQDTQRTKILQALDNQEISSEEALKALREVTL